MFEKYRVENLYYGVVTVCFIPNQDRKINSYITSYVYSTVLHLGEDGQYSELCKNKFVEKYAKAKQLLTHYKIEWQDAFTNYPEICTLSKKKYLSKKEALSLTVNLSIAAQEKRYKMLQEEQKVIKLTQKRLIK